MGSWWLREEWLLLVAALVRVLLVAFGDWQDAHLEVRYTDIDYHVFSDAAALLARGRSPFDRETYRYSPLLALLLVPNTLFHPSWGKLLFSAADLLAGHMIHKILGLQGFHGKTRQLCTALWLFNPFTFTIGTRGNCEALVCCMILRIIYCLHKGCAVEAAIWYGMVVHFRIYPIIYVISLLIALESGSKVTSKSLQSSYVEDAYFLRKAQIKCPKLSVELFHQNKTRILFGAVSGGVFFLLTGVSYYFYRDQFLQEALFYHLTRTDPRHNFSIYFYHIYLHHSHSFSLVERLVSFVPQFLVQSVLTTYFAKDISFCLFIQTVAFVAFNKVITAQYFVWFFCLVPLILPRTNLTSRQSLLCVLLWGAAQLHWLLWAYTLEFRGYNVFFQLWLASLIFFAANVAVLSIIIWHHTSEPVNFKGSVFLHEEVKESKSH
ncbi:hypothetical protein L7F22_037639 [Adiantum nelumboides]|nr:hypothetical protein [Adiantum nelumboides]